jgi:hypothetical protein
MTDAEVEALVLEAVRRYSASDAAGIDSRFDADLRLGDAARQMLFASMAQAFAAKGMSLPSHGFLQRDFLACATPAEVRDSIRERVFGRARAKDLPRPAAPAAATQESQPVKARTGAKRPRAAAKKPAATKATKPSRKRR